MARCTEGNGDVRERDEGAARANDRLPEGRAVHEEREAIILVPAHRGEEVRRALNEKLRDRRGEVGAVLLDRRQRERRGSADRRKSRSPVDDAERRRVRSASGLRVAERRAALVPIEGPALPRRFHRLADEISWVRRVELPRAELREIEGTRIALRAQAGDTDAVAGLYEHYFELMLGWLSATLGDRDPHHAEDLCQAAFLKAIEGLATWERRNGSRFGT